MKPEEFIKGIESAYGSYTPMMRKLVFSYLLSYSDRDLDALFELALATFSSSYSGSRPPDIAIFERAKSENPDMLKKLYVRDCEVFFRKQKIGHYDGSRFIPMLSLLNAKNFMEYLNRPAAYEVPETFIELLPETKEVIKA
jgi:hypothetical protein